MNENIDVVWWRNVHELPSRKERLLLWLRRLAVRNSGVYIHEEDFPFSTTVTLSEVEELSDARLRDALLAQYNDLRNNNGLLTIPMATARSHRLRGVLHVPRN